MSQKRALHSPHIFTYTHMHYVAYVQGLSISVHNQDVGTTAKVWPFPNSSHLMCVSLKLVKVFAAAGRNCGERETRELHNKSNQVRDGTKETRTCQE